MLESLIYAAVAVVTLGIPALYIRRRVAGLTRARMKIESAAAAGLFEPPSLHPVIDPILCIGCGTCVKACPEGEILGLVGGKAELVSPSLCIGHGACQTACPVGAIDLVFGTATRGVDIPHVNPNFESNVPGLYIAGELGGMGLIRNAVTQGRQATEQITQSLKGKVSPGLDLLIVGAGPAGIAATLQAVKSGLKCETVDQAPDFGGTILHFPRHKLVMTHPMEIPLYGKFKKHEITKEELLALFETIIRDTQIQIRFGEKVEDLRRTGSGFEVRTGRTTYTARCVLLAIGRRGTPRKLGVPGEDLSKVAYSLLEPEQFAYTKCLVVGGGDSAVEAALSLAEMDGAQVTMSYRKPAFSRIKEKNRVRLEDARRMGRIQVILESELKAIDTKTVILNHEDKLQELENDFVFIFAGGEPPTEFLAQAGITVETKFGTK
jgi:thioredoxin reductase (NADPH)